MSDTAPFDRCLSHASLWPPDALRASAWLDHAPFAFWLTETLRPATFVELGTHTGFSYLCFCQAIARLGLPASGYAIDTWEGDEQTGLYGTEVLQELAAYHDARYSAFSRLVRSTFDDALPHFDDGSLIDLLHLDGLHTYEAVRHDFDAWRPKLSDRSVVLLHDTNVREDDFGVHRLWKSSARSTQASSSVMATASACWAWARKSHHRSQVCSSQPTTRVTWPWCEPRMRASGEPSDSSTS